MHIYNTIFVDELIKRELNNIALIKDEIIGTIISKPRHSLLIYFFRMLKRDSN